MVLVVKWDSSIQNTRSPFDAASAIFCPRSALNCSFASSDGVRRSNGLPGSFQDLFILRIMRYTVLGETLFIPNFMESMIIISLPVHTFDSMPHAAGCLSIIPEMSP